MIPNHEMIHQFYIKHLPRLNKLLRYRNILWRGGRISAGVIVADDDAWAIACDRGSIDLGGA
jgi:hypothetical protein